MTSGMERLVYGERLKFLFRATVKMKIDRKYDCCLVHRRILIKKMAVTQKGIVVNLCGESVTWKLGLPNMERSRMTAD